MAEQTQKERLYQLLNELHYSQARFEDEIGMSHGSVAHMSDNISANMLRKIKERFPEVSAAWLQTGVGTYNTKDERTQEPIISPERRMLIDEIAAQRVMLDKLLKQQDKLNDNIARCQDIIQMLSERL